MSKKKSSMSLKDFHGGNIPSDLSLPSAPGVFVRSANATNYDRHITRIAPVSRSDQWSRPNSSNASRVLDDKSPFLAPTVAIGRHFDEDERKPLDGSTATRRTVSDENFRSTSSKMETKIDAKSSGKLPGSSPMSHVVNSYVGRVIDGPNSGLVGVPSVAGNSRVHGKPWSIKKDPVVGLDEPVQFHGLVGNVESKLVNPSALDKVSSGRWQTKQIPLTAASDVMDYAGSEKTAGARGPEEQKWNRAVVKEADEIFLREMERSMVIGDGNRHFRRELVDLSGGRSPSFPLKEDHRYAVPSPQLERSELPQNAGRYGVPSTQLEVSERPKLKLLPRTKPLEADLPLTDPRKEASANVKPDVSETDNENSAIDRPRLHLKPRSQRNDPTDANNERCALFGGARPREMVLKDRGIDESALINQETIQPSERAKQNAAVMTKLQGERASSASRIASKQEKKDDNERATWRKPQGQRERQPSPESWRKPAEQPKQTPPHFGKTASALELTQAFSRTAPDLKGAESYKVLAGKSQVPFSRLVNPSHQLNGF